MIELIQQKVNVHDMLSPFSKLDEIYLRMNKDLLEKDISRLKNELGGTKNRLNKKNIQFLIAYLEKVLRMTNEDSIFELCWNADDENVIPSCYPLNLLNEPLYKINICNYVEVNGNSKLVEVDLTDLADIIAFEFINRDLGETHESIEKLLYKCGIMGFESASLLTDYFKNNGDKVYEISRGMKIDDSLYKSVDTKEVIDYFHSKLFKTEYYRDVVDYSCMYANTIIMSTILKNSLHSGVVTKPLLINPTAITFMTNADEVNIKQNLFDDIAIRSFGRRFKIEPKVSIF